VEARNPQALADGIVRLIGHPELREKFAKAGRERVLARYTTEQMVRGTVAVYDQILSEHPKSGEVFT
jgi:spore maturation protein CgeB